MLLQRLLSLLIPRDRKGEFHLKGTRFLSSYKPRQGSLDCFDVFPRRTYFFPSSLNSWSTHIIFSRKTFLEVWLVQIDMDLCLLFSIGSGCLLLSCRLFEIEPEL